MGDVALTFDDGPSEWTEAILDLLQPHGARATFFVVGETAAARPDLLRRIVDEGHEVGNHTWSHPALARDCDDARVRVELERTNAFLEEALGATPIRFRAPHFDLDERVEAIAAELGLAHTPADLSPPDWHERWTSQLTITFVTKQVRPGSVICLHDGVPPADVASSSRQPTVDAIAAIVPRLGEQGLRCVTASELLAGVER